MQRILIGVLVLIIGYLIYRDFRPVPTIEPEIEPHHEAIQTERAKIDSLSSEVERLEDKMTSDSLKSIEARKAFKMRIQELAVSRASERSKVQTLIDTIPILKSFVALQDSTIQAYSARVDSLESEKARQWSDFNKLLDVEREKFQAASEINIHYLEISEHFEKENKRLKRQNRWLKIGTAAGFVGGLLLR